MSNPYGKSLNKVIYMDKHGDLRENRVGNVYLTDLKIRTNSCLAIEKPVQNTQKCIKPVQNPYKYGRFDKNPCKPCNVPRYICIVPRYISDLFSLGKLE